MNYVEISILLLHKNNPELIVRADVTDVSSSYIQRRLHGMIKSMKNTLYVAPKTDKYTPRLVFRLIHLII